MHDRIISILSKGGPLNRAWLLYVATGAVFIGLFSIPSRGMAVILIPLFMLSGLLIFYGVIIHPKRHPKLGSRRIIMSGLGIMAVCGWTRAVALWGVDTQGAGSNVLPTLVWAWITTGLVMLLISTWTRGIE